MSSNTEARLTKQQKYFAKLKADPEKWKVHLEKRRLQKLIYRAEKKKILFENPKILKEEKEKNRNRQILCRKRRRETLTLHLPEISSDTVVGPFKTRYIIWRNAKNSYFYLNLFFLIMNSLSYLIFILLFLLNLTSEK